MTSKRVRLRAAAMSALEAGATALVASLVAAWVFANVVSFCYRIPWFAAAAGLGWMLGWAALPAVVFAPLPLARLLGARCSRRASDHAALGVWGVIGSTLVFLVVYPLLISAFAPRSAVLAPRLVCFLFVPWSFPPTDILVVCVLSALAATATGVCLLRRRRSAGQHVPPRALWPVLGWLAAGGLLLHSLVSRHAYAQVGEGGFVFILWVEWALGIACAHAVAAALQTRKAEPPAGTESREGTHGCR